VVIGHIVSITETVDLETNGLKIVGNLVATEYFVNNRLVADNSVPSVFIDYDPGIYVEMLPYLSTSEYVWSYE
jgi:hypothetical protein